MNIKQLESLYQQNLKDIAKAQRALDLALTATGEAKEKEIKCEERVEILQRYGGSLRRLMEWEKENDNSGVS